MQDRLDHEPLLARFRSWLEQHQDAAEQAESDDENEPPVEPVGLYQLVEQLTALRHEVKLSTKSLRGTEERSEATLLAMQAAIEQFRAASNGDAAAFEKGIRPVVESLLDMDESLVRGRKVLETARQRVLGEAHQEVVRIRTQLDELYRTQSWWRRILCRPWHTLTKDVLGTRVLETPREIFDALLEGYDLIQARLKRALDEHDVIRMLCIGKPVDPNAMTVLEAVPDPGRPAGVVVEEVRPGYYWRGKVLRFAEVKAVAQK